MVISLTVLTLKELELTSFSEALRGDLSLQELFRRESQGRQGWLCLSTKLNPYLAFSVSETPGDTVDETLSDDAYPGENVKQMASKLTVIRAIHQISHLMFRAGGSEAFQFQAVEMGEKSGDGTSWTSFFQRQQFLSCTICICLNYICILKSFIFSSFFGFVSVHFVK